MNLRHALTTIADDPNVTAKIEVGMVTLAAPIVGIAAVGYQVAVARRVAAGRDEHLPEWDDPGVLVRAGLGLAVARLLYELPARLLTLAVLLLALRPLWVAAKASRALWPGPGWQALQIVAVGVAMVLLYNLAYGLLSPAITAQYARHGTLRACFDLPAMLRLMARHPRAYLQVWVVRELAGVGVRLAGLGVGAVVGLLPLVGPLAGTLSWGWLLFVSLLLNGCLVGQLLQLDTRRQLNPSASDARSLRAREA